MSFRTLVRVLGISACATAGLVAGPGGDYLNQYFDSNGVRIHYVEQGAGEPVVLVSGPGAPLEAWIDTGAFQLPYHVIALDCRGEGLSGKPHDPRAYGRETAEDVVRLLDHLHIPKAHIVGYATGAYITAYVLKSHPERFLTAALGNVPEPDHFSGIQVPVLAVTQGDALRRWRTLAVAMPNLTVDSEDVNDVPSPLFMGALARFLHEHPASRRFWAPSTHN